MNMTQLLPRVNVLPVVELLVLVAQAVERRIEFSVYDRHGIGRFGSRLRIVLVCGIVAHAAADHTFGNQVGALVVACRPTRTVVIGPRQRVVRKDDALVLALGDLGLVMADEAARAAAQLREDVAVVDARSERGVRARAPLRWRSSPDSASQPRQSPAHRP